LISDTERELTFREEHRLRVFEKSVLRGIFGPKRDEVIGGWRKLHNEELHNLYSSPSMIRMIKSRRMGWAGHDARMGRKGISIGFWWKSQKERNQQEDLDVGGKTGLIWLKIGTSGGLL
jgi:hypothetical protein